MMRPLAGVAAAFALAATTTPVAAEDAARQPHGPLLELSAYGEVHVTPDMAVISLGVSNQGATAADAMRENATRMTSLVAALKHAGVAEKDVQTSGVNLSPQYNYKPNTPPQLTGYQANNTVRVTVRDLSKLGQTIDAAVGAGGNEVSGISFGLRDPQAAEDAARVEAVHRVEAKAQLYSQTLGKKIHSLWSLSEGGGYTPGPVRPVFMAKTAMAAPQPQTVTEPGELDLRVDVSATYELEP